MHAFWGDDPSNEFTKSVGSSPTVASLPPATYSPRILAIDIFAPNLPGPFIGCWGLKPTGVVMKKRMANGD